VINAGTDICEIWKYRDKSDNSLLYKDFFEYTGHLDEIHCRNHATARSAANSIIVKSGLITDDFLHYFFSIR